MLKKMHKKSALKYDKKYKFNMLTLGDSIAAGVKNSLIYDDYMGASEEFYLKHAVTSKGNWYQNWALQGEDSNDLLHFLKINPSTETFIDLTSQKFDIINGRTFKKNSCEERVKKIAKDTTLYNIIRQVDVIYISIGGNDVIHIRNRSAINLVKSKEIIENNINEAITMIRKLNPNCEIFLNEMYCPYQDKPFSNIVLLGVDKVNEAVKSAVALNNEVYLVEAPYEFVENPMKYFPTIDFHPNREGHALIAQKITESFKLNSRYAKASKHH